MSRRENPSGRTVLLAGLGVLAVGGVGYALYRSSQNKKALDKSADVSSTLPPADPSADPANTVRGYVSAIYTSSPITQDQEPSPDRTDARAYVATIPVTQIMTFGPFEKGDKMPGIATLSPSPDIILVINQFGNIFDFMDKAEFEQVKKTLSG